MRQILKKITIRIFQFACLPIVLWYYALGSLFNRVQLFYSISQFLSLFPGRTSNYLRNGFYSFTLKRLGKDACLCFGCTFSHPDIEIGDRVYIGPYCNLGLCKLEDDVLLGTGVHVMSGTKQHSIDLLDVPIREQQGELLKVVIGQDSWVGNSAVVGANVGKKSVIGANSTVTKDIPPYSVATGSPAEVVRSRKVTPNSA